MELSRVEVYRNGHLILTVELGQWGSFSSPVQIGDEDEAVIRKCGEHLLAFVGRRPEECEECGEPCGSLTDQGGGVFLCPDCEADQFEGGGVG